MSLFIPSYFGPISEYSKILKTETVVFEMEDNFQKQSSRNRTTSLRFRKKVVRVLREVRNT